MNLDAVGPLKAPDHSTCKRPPMSITFVAISKSPKNLESATRTMQRIAA